MSSLRISFLATRPRFLVITLLGCFIGFLTAYNTNKQPWPINALAVIGVLLAHASANVLNDYFDYLNGSDLANVERIAPFTGGSRYIQNNIMKPSQVYGLGYALLAVVVLLGICLSYLSTWKLIPIGIAGMLIAWAYSAPPFQLMSRGIFGELAIGAAWSMVVIGFALLQTDFIVYKSIPLGAAYGFIVANILFLNQVPDITADQGANKITLAVRSEPNHLWKWYAIFLISAYACQLAAVLYGQTPCLTLVTILVLPLFIYCAMRLRKTPIDTAELTVIVPCNILGAHLYALLMCAGLFFGQ